MKIYIAGKITGDSNYQLKFLQARLQLERQGHIVISPAVLPGGMTPGDYMRICFAMIDVADAVAFLPDWKDSNGAKLEMEYCKYISKEIQHPWNDKEEPMGKPRKLGMNTTYIPNAKADMRHHKKVYQRGREKTLRDQDEKVMDQRAMKKVGKDGI